MTSGRPRGLRTRRRSAAGPRKDRDVVAKDRRAVAIKVLRQPNASTRLTQQPRQGRDADFPRVPAQLLAVEREGGEAVEEDGARAASA